MTHHTPIYPEDNTLHPKNHCHSRTPNQISRRSNRLHQFESFLKAMVNSRQYHRPIRDFC